MKVFKADNGHTLTARDELQESAFRKVGLKEVKATKDKK